MSTERSSYQHDIDCGIEQFDRFLG